ncbi:MULTISPECIES: NADH-quinone oxidoreductase subunit A [Nonomuraea]|jgi:NADH-quinone oxidoreductase subunit A|uniref:NADH-quinone oxidoreductase subunit n=7 Tax=Nonomuraea TaxID=83681 RepID=A0A1V0AAV9_9ACTN|nr:MULTISPECIES: NADH-quinone oxidoreductase subunit A [Nonomuraea]SPL94432.1 NADH ubiquinone oxidoreductase chain A [Actinomadura parvosata subsp. kistnae]AQZ67337.1 NADH-quinone oxidoreductase subunit A [Nonomuraea sp. ATCC 55076]NJP95873.1 NADH-quinone oxidoreductase subunit A [Nonomuraea sp. FMUSA5-5]PRX61326.1 NADH dehydrogenase subunit A [Nonomuraea fuscirosea]TYB53742.1 NADH-quinone oxidoreductase subunit A [Nonomuraea sp. PA05]
MDLYVPILVLAVLAGGFAIFSVAIAPFTGPKRWNRAKLDAYECGIEPTPQPVGGGRFPLKYMITAMLFIVFDIEIIFLYPWAVSFAPQTDDLGRVLSSGLGLFALVEMLLFIVTVLVAYAYVWRRKGLDWD